MIKKFILFLLTCTTTLAASPQAIVFDFGGVMTKEQNRDAVIHFLRTSLNLSAERFEQVNGDKRKAIKAGKSEIDFWIDYAKEHNISLSDDWKIHFNTVMREAIGANSCMYALVEDLKKQNLRVALLSNIDERLGLLLKDLGLYEPFNPCLLSCEVGCEKPDPKIYSILLEKMALPAKDILFVDDQWQNVVAAKNLGIDAILFTSQEQLTHEFELRGLHLTNAIY